VALDRAETRALLQDVPKAYQTHINDILLTALGQAFAHWTGGSTLLIDLEGHGREEIVPGVDLSRTVGWFTTIYPVFLHPAQVFQPAKALKAVKEQLRSIPNRGIGYGLLRYYSQNIKLRTQPQAQICFNYLGQVDQILTGFTLFRPAQMSSGPSRSLRGHRHYLLEINGRIADRQLQIDWIYSEHVHRRATIEELASSFMEILRELIEHCQSHEAGGYTPSDFPNMKLSQKELDHLITTLDDFTEGTGH
jgi:non-ribosomal peptide synthase protein (TIGR01720 family)